jgi:RNA repair pathway DNA polymerase beta family
LTTALSLDAAAVPRTKSPNQVNEAEINETERQHSKNLTDILIKSKFDPKRPLRTLESEWRRLNEGMFQGSVLSEDMAAIEKTSTAFIQSKLRDLEVERDIRILFAVESGSRMWGFASPDSDYDVRFVYVPKDLSVYRGFHRIGRNYKDTAKWMSEDRLYDFSGWELPKLLHYLLGLNLSVVEWCTSPIVYLDEGVLEQLSAFVRNNSAFKLLVPSYRGLMLSHKASGLENVKGAMYVARSYLALKSLSVQNTMPTDFTWPVLLEVSSSQ